MFSPNDDGENDFFTVFGRSVSDVTVSIFDRWGDLVYQSYGDTQKGWDGTFMSSPLPTGVFVYLVTYRSQDFGVLRRQSGSFRLVR